jgi:hypothetical protein
MPEGKGHKGFWLQYYPQGKWHFMSNVPFGSRYIKGMGTMTLHPMDTIGELWRVGYVDVNA